MVDYEDDNSDPAAAAGENKESREFMIPYPRLGRYMDYAVLKVLAEYLKENYNYQGMGQPTGQPQLPFNPVQSPSDLILNRELRDMKGKGYGIPIPRVGRRPVPELPDDARSTSSSVGEVVPANGAGIANQSVRTMLADLLRASFPDESKRQQSGATGPLVWCSSNREWAAGDPRQHEPPRQSTPIGPQFRGSVNGDRWINNSQRHA